MKTKIFSFKSLVAVIAMIILASCATTQGNYGYNRNDGYYQNGRFYKYKNGYYYANRGYYYDGRFYREKRLPPGLAKKYRGNIPPGQQKKYRGNVPPGQSKKVHYERSRHDDDRRYKASKGKHYYD